MARRGLLAVLLLMALGLGACEEEVLPPLEQVAAAKEAGDVEKLLQLVTSDERQHHTIRNRHGSVVGWRLSAIAADALAEVLEGDATALPEVERFLQERRDAAETKLERSRFEKALAIINADAVQRYRDHLVKTAFALLAKDPDADKPVIPGASERGLPKIESRANVDAIVVLRKSSTSSRTYVAGMVPTPRGMTTDELNALQARVSTLGVVHQVDTIYGHYTGDCNGVAYQIYSHLFVLNLETQTAVAGFAVLGGKPDYGAVAAFNSTRCDGWGKAADHSVYFSVTE